MANVYLDKKTDRYYIKINKTTIRRDDNGNFFKTEKQASNFLKKIERNNHYLVKGKTNYTCAEIMDDFLLSLKKGSAAKRARTVEKYKERLNKYFMPTFSNTKIKSLNNEMINKFTLKINNLNIRNELKKGILQNCRAFINYLNRYLIIPLDESILEPILDLQALNTNKKQSYISFDDYKKMHDYFTKNNDFKMALLVHILYYYGLRLGEALGLLIESFDFKNNSFIVDAQVSRPNKELTGYKIRSQTKTKYSVREFPLFKETKRLVLNLIKINNLKKDDFIFRIELSNKPISRTNLLFKLNLAQQDLKIDHYSPKDFRTTNLTNLALNNVPITIVMKWAGHVESTTLQKYYVQVDVNEKRKYAEKALIPP